MGRYINNKNVLYKLTSAKTNLLKTGFDDSQLFIIERVNEALTVSKSNDGSITLEGICAVFGQKNENNRIYEKQEYLPHLSYLNEKIQKGQLFGELDHPQSFDVSLKNVSHVVEALTYDEAANTIRIANFHRALDVLRRYSVMIAIPLCIQTEEIIRDWL